MVDTDTDGRYSNLQNYEVLREVLLDYPIIPFPFTIIFSIGLELLVIEVSKTVVGMYRLKR